MKQLNSYLENTSGSMALMFGLTMTCLMIGIGVAIDYSQMSKKKTALQGVADSAVLAAATSGLTTEEEMQQLANKMIAESDYSYANLDLKLKSDRIRVDVSSTHALFIMGAFGQSDKNINAMSEAPLAGGGRLNMALVLDTTKSMEGARMTALKQATNELLTDLAKYNETDDNLKVSLVPFSDYVRIDQTLEGVHWLETQPGGDITWDELDEDNSTGCETVGSGENAYTRCDNPVYVEKSATVSWEGCMGSRKDDFHKVSAFDGRRLQGLITHSSCNGYYNASTPLSADLEEVNASVQGLDSIGKTYLPAGLIWGWRTLDPQVPFTEAAVDANDDVRNIMLLMTDGSNTVHMRGEKDNFNGYFHWGDKENPESSRETADELTEELCSSIKADGIEIYAIAFEVDSEDTKVLLEDCASSPVNYYNANSAAELKKAFKTIGNSLDDIRLMR